MRYLLFLFLLFFWGMFASCSLGETNESYTGTASELPNTIAGVVVDSAGQPQQNASVYLLKSAGWVEAKNDGESVVLDSTVTDTLGA
ncbi:MAG: hypothetical protein OCC49_20245, partial [Fibrobacterales bacterium]